MTVEQFWWHDELTLSLQKLWKSQERRRAMWSRLISFFWENVAEQIRIIFKSGDLENLKSVLDWYTLQYEELESLRSALRSVTWYDRVNMLVNDPSEYTRIKPMMDYLTALEKKF